MSSILERALAAEEQLESRDVLIAELEARLRAIVGADPQARMAAQTWIRRAELAEALLREMDAWATSWPTVPLPEGWLARCRAQLHTLDIVGRGDIRGEHLGYTPAPVVGQSATGDMWEVVNAEGKSVVLQDGDSLMLKDIVGRRQGVK